MRRMMIAGIVLGLLMAGLAQGATIRYHGAGPWEWLEGVGQPEGWQSANPPGALDTVRANWGGATITLDYATTVNKFELGVDESGEFHILAGGNLTTTADSRIGNNGASAAVVGTLTIDAGGEVNVGGWLGIGHGTPGVATVDGTLRGSSHLWMGETSDADSVGTLTINNGGFVDIGGNLGLGTINASTPSGGTAEIHVMSGGLLSLNHWDNVNSIQAGSVLNINGTGVVTVGGNRVDAANDYFALGKIASDQGGILATFDGPSDTTTIVAIPEPTTLALLALAGLGLTIRRKR